jgi:hypothetical protein
MTATRIWDHPCIAGSALALTAARAPACFQ